MDFKTFSKNCAYLIGNTTLNSAWSAAKSSASIAVGARLLGLSPVSNVVSIAAAGGAVLGATRTLGLNAYSFFCKSSESNRSVVINNHDNNLCLQATLKTFIEMGKQLASSAIGYSLLSHISSLSLGQIAIATATGFACLVPVTALILLGALGWDKMKNHFVKDYGIQTEEDVAHALLIGYHLITDREPKRVKAVR
ncbi:MAG: hypothetical protein ACYCQI_07485 [Gammaproteobacteria bacterium]